MGLTINLRHRTKSLDKINAMLKDLEIWANNTGRYFKVYIDRGVSQTWADPQFGPDAVYDYQFIHSEYPPSGQNVQPSVAKGFEIEIKSGTTDAQLYAWGFQWFKRGDYWICHDWHKVYGPSTDGDSIIAPVIEIIGILMWIKKYHFPDLKIQDETQFYVSYDELPESQKQYWKDIKAGKRESYRRADGTFPDYLKEYRKLKKFDPQNIQKSIGSMDAVFRKIEGNLAKVGYTDDMIVKDMPIRPAPSHRVQTTQQIGSNTVRTIVDNIQGTVVQKKQPVRYRPMPRRDPLRRTLIKRKDGVTQHYTKRLR